MSRNHWWVTRPKRKLIVIPDILKIFAVTAEGQKWRGNRQLQLEFERALKNYEWKAQNISHDGSGARTYAVMLFMLGLWFEDANGVQLTNAGKELVADNPPVPILTKQLLDFQYPSPYSRKRQVDIGAGLRLQPYRFILNLFIEKNLEEISQDEIAFCLVPYAKKGEDIERCYGLVMSYRNDPSAIVARAVVDSGTTEDNLRNIGNTMVNQLEYTGYFEERTDISSLRLKPNKRDEVRSMLEGRRTGLIQANDEATFQMRYGAGLISTRDHRYSNSTPPGVDPNDRAILVTYLELALNKPIVEITEELIQTIAERRGVSIERTRRVLSTFAQRPQYDRFEEKYLKLSIGGTSTADDFEVKTTGIFSGDGFGYVAKWVGSFARHPDIFVYFDEENKQYGLIDTKAYSEYNLPLDHKNKMAHTYIPSFQRIQMGGVEYDLKFFCYVAGGFGPGMSRSFAELLSMTDVRGSFITARNLLQLLKLHRANPFSHSEFCNIFASNQEIIYDRISRVTTRQ